MRSRIGSLPFLLISACVIDGHYFEPKIQVSPDGDDANDGFSMPIRTIKRGIGIAAADAAITAIRIAAGRYDASSGETFPYTVPANVTIAGPAGGGAILAGTSAEPGLFIGAGELRDLELESFTVAVTGNGTAQLTNLRVRSSGIAIRGEAGARLTVTKLDITRTAAGACATPGVELNADADLTGREISTRALGLAFLVKDQTTVSISNANISGNAACGTPSFVIRTAKTFALNDSIVDGGPEGIHFDGATIATTATLTDTTLRNMIGKGLTGQPMTLTMTGGEISSNGQSGVEAIGGTWTFDNVILKQNGVMGVYIQSPGTLAMHGCTLTNNLTGVYLLGNSVADLGTVANPGNNTFMASSTLGLDIDDCTTPHLITAVGNTWRPNL